MEVAPAGVLLRYSRYLTTRTLSVERFQVRVRFVAPVAVTTSRRGIVGAFLSRDRRGDLAGRAFLLRDRRGGLAGDGLAGANARTTGDDFAVDVPGRADAAAPGPAANANAIKLAAARNEGAMWRGSVLATSEVGEDSGGSGRRNPPSTAKGAPCERFQASDARLRLISSLRNPGWAATTNNGGRSPTGLQRSKAPTGAGFGSTERRMSRTYRAVAYTTAPVLKTFEFPLSEAVVSRRQRKA